MKVEDRLRARELVLPEPAQIPNSIQIPFAWVRIRGNHVYVSGHSAQSIDGSVAGPFGKVAAEVSLEAACEAAKAAGLSILASLKRALRDLDRISAWLMINGLINASPGFSQTTQVINGVPGLILELFGEEIGTHARTAIGVASLPLNCSVIVSAQLEIAV